MLILLRNTDFEVFVIYIWSDIEASKTAESVLGSGSNEVSEMIPVQWSESSDIKASYNQELKWAGIISR